MKFSYSISLFVVIILQLWTLSKGKSTICDASEPVTEDDWLTLRISVGEDGSNWSKDHACTCEIKTGDGILKSEVSEFLTIGSRDKYSCHPHLQIQHLPDEFSKSSFQMCAAEDNVHTPYKQDIPMNKDATVHLVLHNYNHQNITGTIKLQFNGTANGMDIQCSQADELPKVCPCNEVVEVATIVTIISVIIIYSIIILNCIVCFAHKGTNHYIQNEKVEA